MAATTESVKTDAAEAPLLNKKNMILAIPSNFVKFGKIRHNSTEF